MDQLVIDPEAPAALRLDLAQFVNGEMSSKDFHRRWFDVYRNHPDLAVAAISTFGQELVDIDPIGFTHPTGENPAPTEVREAWRRCHVFLHSERVYLWPATPRDGLIVACVILVGLSGFGGSAGILICQTGYVLMGESDWSGVWWTLLTSSLLLVIGIAVLVGWNYLVEQRQSRFWSHGDRHAWPFLHVADVPQNGETIEGSP